MSESIQPARDFAEVNGAKLYYEVTGAGHPLVLLHEGIADSRMYDDQFNAFAQHYRVVRFDLRGFGQSDLPPRDAPIALYEDLYGLLAFLGIKTTYVLGMSMGGAIALDFTLAHPAMVDALILVAPGVSGYNMTSFEEEYQAIGEEIEEAVKRGDYEHASELETRIWVDGPERTPQQVDPGVRQRVYEMNLHNFRNMGTVEFPRHRNWSPQQLRASAKLQCPPALLSATRMCARC